MALPTDAHRRVTGAALTDAQTVALLRAMADDPELGTDNTAP